MKDYLMDAACERARKRIHERRKDMHYILDGHTPVEEKDVVKWGIWFETADRKVKKTSISDEVEVSTVFLGLDHRLGSPLLFETLVFGGETDGDMKRYSTWEEAEIGHDRIVQEIGL